MACKVLINNSKDNLNFILYNHLYSRKDSKVTVNALKVELEQYSLYVPLNTVQEIVSKFVDSGILYEGCNYYRVC